MLFLSEGSGYGIVHCKHSACAGVTTEDWIAELGGDEGSDLRRVRIVGAWVELPKICLELEPLDDEELPFKYLRIHSRPAARWDALFAACALETPNPKDEREVNRQAKGLMGAVIDLEVTATGSVRKILATKEQAA